MVFNFEEVQDGDIGAEPGQGGREDAAVSDDQHGLVGVGLDNFAQAACIALPKLVIILAAREGNFRLPFDPGMDHPMILIPGFIAGRAVFQPADIEFPEGLINDRGQANSFANDLGGLLGAFERGGVDRPDAPVA